MERWESFMAGQVAPEYVPGAPWACRERRACTGGALGPIRVFPRSCQQRRASWPPGPRVHLPIGAPGSL